MNPTFTYWRTVVRRGFSDTAFFTRRYILLGLAVAILGVGLQWVCGIHPWNDIELTFLVIIASYLIVVVVACVYNLFRLPAVMHSEQNRVVSDLQEAAHIEQVHAMTQASLRLVTGPTQRRVPIRMKWSCNAGESEGTIAVTSISILMHNEGSQAIKTRAFELTRTEPSEGTPERVKHYQVVRPGGETNADITNSLLLALARFGTSDFPDFQALRGCYKLSLVLEYQQGAERRHLEPEVSYSKVTHPASEVLDIEVSFEPFDP